MKKIRVRNRVVPLLALLATVLPPGLAGAAEIELISRAPLRQAPETAGGGFPLSRTALSADGRYFVFASFAPNLVPGQVDPNFGLDIFFHDRVAGTLRLISHASGAPATAGERPSDQPVMSADGRFVAFVSAARNLVAGTGDVPPDPAGGNVFLWDRETGQLTLVSHRAGSGEGGNGASLSPSLSADGGVLVFTSKATDLIPGLTLAHPGENVYAYERATGTLSLVSRSAASPTRSGNNTSFGPVVSADGRFVAYLSGATDLVAGQNDANGDAQDVFLFDRLTGATALVSHVAGSALTTPNGSSHGPTLSADGRYVAFGSNGTDLVPGVADTNGEPEAFLYDRLSGAVTWVSLSGTGAAEGGFQPRISQDGGTVVYFIGDPNVHAGGQIVAYDVLTGSRSLVTHTPGSPATPANRGATSLSISADGRIVAFTSAAINLVSGQQDALRGASDVFVHDRASGVTVLASHAAGSPTRTGDQASVLPDISADRGWIAYGSFATDLVTGVRDSPATFDLFLYERATGGNRLITRHAPGLSSRTALGDSRRPAMSADGRYVAFVSAATLLPGLVVPPGRRNVYLHNRVTGQTVLVSRSTRAPFAGGDADSEEPRISRDGNFVLFHSLAGDLAPGQEDRGGTYDVFLWDRRTGRTTLVSHARASRVRAGTGLSFVGDVSANGDFVVFNSTATGLAPRQQDINQGVDVFLWNRRTDSTVLVSHNGLRPARTANVPSLFTSMTPDGAFVAFEGSASDLALPTPDGNGQNDAFVFERRTGRIALLSRAAGSFAGAFPLISADGRWAAFLGVKRLQSGFQSSMIVLDRATGGAVEVDLSHDVDGFAQPLGLSDDGRWLLFSSDAPDLVPGQIDAGITQDVFLFDRASRTVRLVSHVPGDPLRASGRDVNNGRLSPNGRWAAFQSNAPLLPDPGSPQVTTIYLYDRTTEDVTLVSRSAFNPPQPANGESFEPVVVDSGLVAFASQASDLVPRDFNAFFDVFVYVPESP
jgi:Tol biopolymer transport system component